MQERLFISRARAVDYKNKDDKSVKGFDVTYALIDREGRRGEGGFQSVDGFISDEAAGDELTAVPGIYEAEIEFRPAFIHPQLYAKARELGTRLDGLWTGSIKALSLVQAVEF